MIHGLVKLVKGGALTDIASSSCKSSLCVAVSASTQISIVEFDPGCEAMIYTTDGTPLQGMSPSVRDL
jgi:hypothetical protein